MVLVMVLLSVLSGPAAGTQIVARRFPFRVGRGSASHLRLDLAGVWDNHFVLEPALRQGILLRAEPGATTLVNRRQIEAQAVLRPGDVIEAGGARFRFGLSPPAQRGLGLREGLTWAGLVLLVVFQLFVAAKLTP